MPSFRHGETEIAFLDQGEGEPIVLVHGFASTKEVNWVNTGWLATLVKAGRRAIALDNRGHGASTKFYRPEDYRNELMAGDVRALLAHLGIERADVMGYSMGARIAAYLALAAPLRVRSAILGGLGIHLVDGGGLPSAVAEAMEAPSLAEVTDPSSRMFRSFAEQTTSDLKALAACIRGSRRSLSPEDARRIAVPVLIAVGTRDAVAGSAEALAAIIPGAQVLDIPDCDHMRAVGDKRFKEGVLRFLNERP